MIEINFEKKLPHFTLKTNITLNNGILSIVGPSGAGKTTLLQCIAGLQTPTDGYIKINTSILFSSKEKLNMRSKNRNIGYVFQDYALFPHMNVEKNIRYGLSKDDEINNISINDVLEKLKITHLKKRFPRQISGGEKQRVALARALVTSPKLLLLDEPLSALDDETRNNLQLELKKLQSLWKIPFILVTHDMKEAELLGNKIIKIDKGNQVTIR